jgi:hypothetical protein
MDEAGYQQLTGKIGSIAKRLPLRPANLPTAQQRPGRSRVPAPR